ncbi:MAG: hypothetical protein WDZ35_14270 [Crocinitomicaceae bacterium]
MKKYICAFILLISYSFLSLGYEVKFGPTEQAGKRGKTLIIGEFNGNIYVYKYKSLPLGVEKHYIHKYNANSLETIEQKEIDIKAKNFEGIYLINDKLVIFEREKDIKNNLQKLFYHIYNPNTLSIEKSSIKIAEFEFERKLFSSKGGFNVVPSENRTKFAVYYDLPYNKGEAEKFGVAVFSGDFDVILDASVTLPSPDELMSLGNPYLSNDGRFYISATEVSEKRLFRLPSEIKHHIFEVSEGGKLNDYLIDLQEKYIYDYTYETNPEGNLVCSGFYGEPKRDGVAGGFFLRINKVSRAIEEASFKDFPLEFITAGWSDRSKKKAKKRKDKGKGNPTLYSYDIRNVVALDDGGAILTAEQYYVRVVTYRDANGNTRTTYYYYYNDIIVMKLNNSGKFDWYAKIPKFQVSTNDGGYYSSYSFHVGKEKLYFMFNDNIKNFEKGDVVGGKTYAANLGNQKNVTSLVEMNISDGKMNKKKLFSKSELKTIAVPKVYHSDRQLNTLYIFSKKKRKERLGLIRFQ